MKRIQKFLSRIYFFCKLYWTYYYFSVKIKFFIKLCKMHVLWNFGIQFKVNQITLYRFLNYESIDCNYVSGSEAWKNVCCNFSPGTWLRQKTGESKRLRNKWDTRVVRYILALVTRFFSLDSNSFQKSRLTIFERINLLYGLEFRTSNPIINSIHIVPKRKKLKRKYHKFFLLVFTNLSRNLISFPTNRKINKLFIARTVVAIKFQPIFPPFI